MSCTHSSSARSRAMPIVSGRNHGAPIHAWKIVVVSASTQSGPKALYFTRSFSSSLPPQTHATENLHAFALPSSVGDEEMNGPGRGWFIQDGAWLSLVCPSKKDQTQAQTKKRPQPCFPKVTKAKFLSCWALGDHSSAPNEQTACS